MNTHVNNPHRFWPDADDTQSKQDEGGASEHARTGTSIPPIGGTPSYEAQRESTETYHAPGVPEGTPEHIPSTYESEVMPKDTSPGDWGPDEVDSEGVVHVSSKGASQTSFGVWIFLFFATIALVILGIFLHRYFAVNLGLG
jgi:hypothetical protein